MLDRIRSGAHEHTELTRLFIANRVSDWSRELRECDQLSQEVGLTLYVVVQAEMSLPQKSLLPQK
jgi:hypothetical protein